MKSKIGGSPENEYDYRYLSEVERKNRLRSKEPRVEFTVQIMFGKD